MKTAQPIDTKSTPHDSLGTLVFPKSNLMSKFHRGPPPRTTNGGGVGKRRRFSTYLSPYLETVEDTDIVTMEG